MQTSPLDRRIIERAIERRNVVKKDHTTAIRVPTELWSRLVLLKQDTSFSINQIMLTAISDLIDKESKRLGFR